MVFMSANPAAPAPAAETVSAYGGRRIADYLATTVLAFGHLVLYAASFTWLGLMVMSTDACAYQNCGDEAWLWRAIHLNGWGGAALVAIDFAVMLWRLVRNRAAWFVPLLGCVAQLALALGCVALEMKAGPIK